MVRKRSVKAASGRRVSRRDLLRWTAGLGAGLATRRIALPDTPRDVQFSPWWMSNSDRSLVIEARSKNVIQASQVDGVKLAAMLGACVRRLTGMPEDSGAWRHILGPAKRIVLKFNSVGAGLVGTNYAIARVIVGQLEEAGFFPKQIWMIETGLDLEISLETATSTPGWGETIIVGHRPVPLARYILDADAVISVGLLKPHTIAHMSCCMLNLSHAAVRHPARYHANGCSPFVGEIIGSEPVSRRLKLSILNGLRIITDRGADATSRDVLDWGGLLVGFDPVAVDAFADEILRRERKQLGLEPLPEVTYLRSANDMGVGRSDSPRRELAQVETD